MTEFRLEKAFNPRLPWIQFAMSDFGELFPQEVKEMGLSWDEDKNSLLALAVAWKSASDFKTLMALVEHDLSTKEVYRPVIATIASPQNRRNFNAWTSCTHFPMETPLRTP